MLFSTLQNSFSVIILISLMTILIFADRSFYRSVRYTFYVAMLGIITLILLGIFGKEYPEYDFVLDMVKNVLRTVVLFMWIKIVLNREEKPMYYMSMGFVVTNLTLSIIGICLHRSYITFTNLTMLFLMFALVYACVKDVIRKDNKESFFIFFELLVLIIATVLTIITGNQLMFDEMLGVCLGVYYCYIVGQFYKRDALTHLLNRHNMYYDMEELHKSRYGVVLIDIDNFKLINDKYGHDKGDEALATVSSMIKVCLPKGCRMYRFGGDEFVIISKEAGKEELERAFQDADIILEEKNYSISRGYAVHEPGTDDKAAITAADKEMYRHKREMKSDDIWDVMTGLFNLRGFIDELDVMKKKVLSTKQDVCLVCLDIEHLNNINTAYGYLEGNQVIITLAKIIQGCVGEGEFIAHLGGDEFAVALITDKNDEEKAKRFINNLSAGVKGASEFEDKEYTISLNFSTLFVNVDKDTQMDKAVDKVLYQKQTDKDNRRKSLQISATEEVKGYDEKVEKQVLDIIDHNKLRYAFQPIVSAKDGEIVAYEALMRSDTDPMVPPLTILQYAARNKRYRDIEKQTFFNVLAHMEKHQDILQDKRIFINSLPGYTMYEKDYEEWAGKYSSMLDRLVVEITEQKELEDGELEIINDRRKKAGFSLAIDDFGSGCSNTNSLLRYMPEVIKLDRLLISGIHKNSKKQYFINSIVMFAKQNAMSVLAEGVETEEELKMVIRLGVDYIQGFYTAKPDFDFLTGIEAIVKKTIVEENIRGNMGENRKVYIAGSEEELSLVHLALEEYTGLTIAVPKLILTGGFGYNADMNIKIKDGLTCDLILRDVSVNAVDNLPCIELGEGSKLTLYLEGDNLLKARGIYVPEGSSLTILGNGNLDIQAKGHECYGIGTNSNESIGDICLKHSGTVTIHVDGESCVAIGGGSYRSGKGIALDGGKTKIMVAAVTGVAIGCMEGKVPVRMFDNEVETDLRVSSGTAVGSLHDEQNINLDSFDLKITGNGSNVGGIGSVLGKGGTINLNSGSLNAKLNGQNIGIIGTGSGDTKIDISHVRVNLHGEGDRVVGIGNIEDDATLNMEESVTKIVIFAANAKAYGLRENGYTHQGPIPVLKINEQE